MLRSLNTKMKCPKCNEEINWLKGYTETKYEVTLNEKGELEYDRVYEMDYVTGFECPECDEELFTQESDALEFLNKCKGEK